MLGFLAGVNPWMIVGALVALAAATAAGGKLGYDLAAAQCKSAELDRELLAERLRTENIELADEISARTEQQLGRIRITNRTITQEVRHEREVYTQVLDNPACAVPVSTVRVLNRARGAPGTGSGAGEPASPMPGTAAPAGPGAAAGGTGGS